MSFDKELQDIFGVDIWFIKPSFKKDSNARPINNTFIEVDTQTTDKKTKHTLVEGSPKIDSKLIYTNENASSKIINVFISDQEHLSFVKNICDKLFYKSLVNIYIGTQHIDNNININFDDCLFVDKEVLSVANKKNILESLYQYADFRA